MATQSATQSQIILQVRVRERWGSLGKEWSNQANEILYYYQPANTSRKVTLSKPSKNSLKRTVDGIFDKIEYDYNDLKTALPVTGNTTGKGSVFTTGDNGEMAFIFDYITRQAAKLKKEPVWDGFSFVNDTVFLDFNDNSLFLGEWTSTKIINGITETYTPPYFGQSPNTTDVKYRKKFGFRPPYWEIVQDPYKDGPDPKFRVFGNQGKENGYFLNNGSYVEIQWFDKETIDDGMEETPLLNLAKYESSDNWGRELDISDITNSTSYKIDNILKKATIYPKDGDPFVLAQQVGIEFDGNGTASYNRIRKDIGFVSTFDIKEDYSTFSGSFSSVEPKIWQGKSNKLNTGILDSEILDEILKSWQQVYKNTKLKYFNPIGVEQKSDLKYVSPVLITLKTATGASGATGVSSSIILSLTGASGGTGATGTSASVTPPRQRVYGSYIFDVTRAGFLINYGTGGTGPGLTSSGLGELEILERRVVEDPFTALFEEDEGDLTELAGSEYTEDISRAAEEIDLPVEVFVYEWEISTGQENSTSVTPTQAGPDSGKTVEQQNAEAKSFSGAAEVAKPGSFDALIDLAGKCARELGKNARVNAGNMKKGYIKGVHGLCPQGTQAVAYALTGLKVVGAITGNADWFSWGPQTPSGGPSSFAKTGYYREKEKVGKSSGSAWWKGTYIDPANKKDWRVGDIIAMAYTGGKSYGHIQIWTGHSWMSDFKQGDSIQKNNVNPDSVALWRLNEKGIAAVKNQLSKI